MFRIRPLRLANFRAVLEQLAEDVSRHGDSDLGPELKTHPGGGRPVAPVFPFAPEGMSGTPRDRSSRSGGAYQAYEQEAASAAAPRGAPPAPKNDEEQVAEELRLSLGLTPAELRRRRRDFARSHHPDRVPERFRETATRQMSIANAMIDGALRNRARS